MKEFHGLFLAEDAFLRLESMLSAHRNGCRQDYYTPILGRFGAGATADLDLSRAECAADLADHCKLDGLPMWLREVEANQRRKHGTYSKVPPFDSRVGGHPSLRDLSMRYFNGHSAHIQERAAIHADKYVASLIRTSNGDRLSPVDLRVAAESFERQTGFGWPVISSNPRYYEPVYEMSRHLMECPCKGQYPALLGTRGQPSGPYLSAKARVVYQCSRVIGNIEKMFFIPMFRYLRDMSMFSAWGGPQAVNWGVTGLFDDCRGPFLSVDYTNFDATVTFDVLRRIFRIIRGWFTVSSHPLIKLIEDQFLGCSIITPDGLISGRTGGIPSGSVLTNLVGSLVNVWSMAYAAYRCGATIHRGLVQGDDGVFTFNGDVTPFALSSVMQADLGMVMSVDKNYNSPDEIHFLSMVHRRSFTSVGLNVGVRPLMRVLNGMMSYERLRTNWSGHMDSLRWFQQLEMASEHPCFSAACEWLLKNDRFACLPVTALIERAGGEGYVRAAIGGWDGVNTIARLVRSRVSREMEKLTKSPSTTSV